MELSASPALMRLVSSVAMPPRSQQVPQYCSRMAETPSGLGSKLSGYVYSAAAPIPKAAIISPASRSAVFLCRECFLFLSIRDLSFFAAVQRQADIRQMWKKSERLPRTRARMGMPGPRAASEMTFFALSEVRL